LFLLALLGLLGSPVLAASPKDQRPNILLAVADDWSYHHAGAYGCPWVRTPALDRVAREGILFTNAYTPNAKCAPSRACLLTGRNPWQLKAACNHVCYFPLEFKTYAEALAANDYWVGMTCKGWAPGVANDAQGKPRAMAGRPFNKRTAPPPTTGISRNDYSANFIDFLDAAPPGQPWCFWYGSVEPHRPYEYGSGRTRGGKHMSDLDRVPGYWPNHEVVRNDMLDYALEVEHFDRHLGRMLTELEKRGQLANTLIVVTSDNGMPFPRAKGNQYEISNHMPLAAMWRGGIRAPGRVVTDFVSFIDLAPTFIEVSGLKWEQTSMAPAAGRSLTDIFRSEQKGRVNPLRDHVLLGQERHDVGRPHDWGYPIRSIVTDGWMYLHNFEPSRWPTGNPETGYLNTDGGPTKTLILADHRQMPADPFWAWCFGKRGSEELYDLKNDPDCLKNCAAQASYQGRKEQLKQRLFAALRAQRDPRMFGQGGVFEAEPFAQPAQRHFYERYLKGEKIRAGWVNDSDFEKGPLD
jgi:arylsulfatase A-like enzyme